VLPTRAPAHRQPASQRDRRRKQPNQTDSFGLSPTGAVTSPLLSSSHPQPTHSNALLPSHLTCAAPRRAAQPSLFCPGYAATHISSSASLPPSSSWIGIDAWKWMTMAGSCAAVPVAGLPSLRTPMPTHLRLGGFMPCSSAARSRAAAVLGCALGARKQTPGVLNQVLASYR
jgi:hypothetical protein